MLAGSLKDGDTAVRVYAARLERQEGSLKKFEAALAAARTRFLKTQRVLRATESRQGDLMAKLALMPILIVIACIIAGLYGAIHNQISYSVSPEYFTQFKFHQFRIEETIPPRVGAAVVGFLAAWWMGIVIGIVLTPIGLVIGAPADYFRGMIRVFGVVALTTLIVGLGALTVSFLTTDAETVPHFSRHGNEIIDDLAFARAGTMHNFSYLGGLIGIVTGIVAIFRERRRRKIQKVGGFRGDMQKGS